MTVDQLRDWLRSWVANATGLDTSDISDDAPLESFGLSSRDAVVLSGELENLLDTSLDATVAYQYPTIAKLAERLLNPAANDAAATPAGDGAGGRHRLSDTLPRRGEQHEDIAVVGYAGRFPGANSAAAFWDMLAAGETGTGPLPEGRWAEYADDQVLAQKMAEQNLTGGYLDDIAGFDAEFFGLSPLEAENMDPQQRIILELAWQALEDAHLPANELRGTATSVYVGSSNNDYGMLISADPAESHPYALTGTSSAVVANRVSYAFDFRGLSVNVDTACSSSLVAVHQAVRGLRSGDADVALAGGVNIMSSPFVSTAFGELGVISPSGAIHAFSDDADGFVRADAAGLLVLKRLSDAEADGDDIRAVIKGTAVNSDGHSNGLTAPNPEAQVDVLRRAYADAGIDPRDVDYIEAHGTGTILGDPIEASALGEVLGAGAGRPVEQPTLLGSAKSNIGHSESAAGSVALIKVLESIVHDTLPPSVNYSGPNRYIDFDAERLEVVTDAREWPEYSGHKVAGVSGFGFGGTNAHIVLTDYHPSDSAAEKQDDPAALPQIATQTRRDRSEDAAPDATVPASIALPVSGLLPSRRRAAAGALADYIDKHELDHAGLLALARSLARRNHGRSRAVVTAADADEAVKRLRQVAEGKVSVGIAAADSPSTVGPVFVYSGFGSQHRKMAKDLVEVSPLFAQRLEELDEVVTFESGWSILEIVHDDAQTYDTETAQVAITAIQIALTDLLAHFGVRPAAVQGMSMGEIAAAYAAGGISANDAMLIAAHRARLMGEGESMLTEEQQGAMAVVEMSAAEVDELDGNIEPAVYTAPGMTTVGGPRQEVLDLVERLDGEGKFARALKVKGAGHTSAVDPLQGELAAEIAGITAHPLHTTLFSTVDKARVYQPGETIHDVDYWLRMTRGSVYFQDATEQAFAHGHTMMVEIAPNPVALMGMMNTAFVVGKPDAQLLYTLKRKVDPSESLLDLLGKMYVAGQPVNYSRVFGRGTLLPAPGVEFRRKPLWTAARPSSAHLGLPGAKVTLPDGTIAFSAQADAAPSAHALIAAAATAVRADAHIAATQDYHPLPTRGEVTTTVATSLGGLHLKVYSVADGMRLVAEGFAPALGGAAANASDANAGAADTDAMLADATLRAAAPAPGRSDEQTAGGSATAGASDEVPGEGASGESADDQQFRWDPEKETVEERLSLIVSESMGYDVSDLPRELPLIDLGLDSLMGMRIKNRVENDFQIPPLQVQALRDASLADVITMVEEAVEKKEEPSPESGESHTAGITENGQAPDLEAGETAASGESGTDTDAEAGTVAAAEADAESASEPDAEAQGVGVAPRDASERMVFGTWATFTGKAAAGVTSELPDITDEVAQQIAERLTERAGIEVTAEQVKDAETLEPLANLVREGLETEVEGNIRVLREADGPAVFMFHPAGGSSVVYQPLARRLPESVAVYGVERLEGPLEERAETYVEDIKEYARGRKVVLGGWSFGGALAYEVARLLQDTDVDVAFIALLDTTRPSDPAPDTIEEVKARWERYAAFAKKTYDLDFPVPYELLETAGEEALIEMLQHFLATTDASEHGLSAGVLEHQRASFVDNHILGQLDFARWKGMDIPVLLFRSERMHDGAIELEPRYAHIDPDGGWSAIVKDLQIVQVPGDHLAVPDEPAIGIVGKWMTQWIEEKIRGNDGGQAS